MIDLTAHAEAIRDAMHIRHWETAKEQDERILTAVRALAEDAARAAIDRAEFIPMTPTTEAPVYLIETTPADKPDNCPSCGDPANMFRSDGFHAPGKTYWPAEALRTQSAVKDAELTRVREISAQQEIIERDQAEEIAAKNQEIARLTADALDVVENLIDLATDDWEAENPDIKRAIQFRNKCRAAMKAPTNEIP